MKRILRWLALYLGWLFLAFVSTVGGALLLMLFKDWTIGSVFTSLLAWPVMGLAMLAAVPIVLIGFGRIYIYTALGGGLLFNLYLAFA